MPPARHEESAVFPIAVSLAIGLSFWGGDDVLGLVDADSGATPSDVPAPPAELPSPTDPAEPHLPLPLGVGMGAAALAAILARRHDLAPGDALALDESPIVVFVPGHGQGHGSTVFADLVRNMQLEPGSSRYFDYRLAGGVLDLRRASAGVPVDAAATALNGYIAGVAEEGRPVYLVGFSKGGATIAELIADWDDGRWGAHDAVVGAALLDPPIASGPHGWLQSLGRYLGPVADDGGYTPVQCRFLRFGCEDRRIGLGTQSGVEVVVVRNPKAGITSFADRPPGLRVYDAPDDGPTILGQLARNPIALPARIAQAHESVIHDRAVAACIVAEMRSGRCDLPARSSGPKPAVRRPAVRAPSAQKML